MSPSSSEFERLSSTAARMRSRFLRTVLANFTNAGMRERLAQRNHHSRCAGASAGLRNR
jgi:hypothetical protein